MSSVIQLDERTIALGVITGLIEIDGKNFRLTKKGEEWMREWTAERLASQRRRESEDDSYPDSRFSNLAKLRKRRARRRAKAKVAKQSRKANRAA